MREMKGRSFRMLPRWVTRKQQENWKDIAFGCCQDRRQAWNQHETSLTMKCWWRHFCLGFDCLLFFLLNYALFFSPLLKSCYCFDCVSKLTFGVFSCCGFSCVGFLCPDLLWGFFRLLTRAVQQVYHTICDIVRNVQLFTKTYVLFWSSVL